MTNNSPTMQEIFAQALQMEREGKALYEKAEANCQNKLGQAIFHTLMEDEIVHQKRIQEIYTALINGEAFSNNWLQLTTSKDKLHQLFQDMTHQLNQAATQDASELEAIKIGEDFELASIRFYEDGAKSAAAPLEKAFFEKMIDEERGHFKALSDLYLYLSDPYSWFVAKEKTILDGA